MISVWLRNVGDDDDDCWVVCAKGDPGAVEFIGCPLFNPQDIHKQERPE